MRCSTWSQGVTRIGRHSSHERVYSLSNVLSWRMSLDLDSNRTQGLRDSLDYTDRLGIHPFHKTALILLRQMESLKTSLAYPGVSLISRQRHPFTAIRQNGVTVSQSPITTTLHHNSSSCSLPISTLAYNLSNLAILSSNRYL